VAEPLTDASDFLGRGWAFPDGLAPDDEIAMVADAEDIRQSIRLILATDPGERVMRPDFGAGLRALLFEPINANTVVMVRHRVEEALVTWEPRIDVQSVAISAEEAASGRLLIRIDYAIRATNTFDNLVYPFYLRESG